MSPATRARIALLLEGHVQYSFMTISQIEKFYSRFYQKWNRDAYYGLMKKLRVSDRQRISTMSCGQRSQVALGLILAQNADLLVLDDFSLGLDPGYRRLFVDYLREFARAEDKTVFMTSHIIQDMERLIDDCIILDYGKILAQMPVEKLMRTFTKYVYLSPEDAPLPADEAIVNPARVRKSCEVYSFLDADKVRDILSAQKIPFEDFHTEKMSLEDVFIGMTGKY